MKKLARFGWAALAAIACTGFAEDSVWVQQQSVAIGAANFQQCVKAAIANVPSVSINLAGASSADVIPLDVKLAKPIPFLIAQVQHRGGNALISFSGSGDSESDADRKALDPLVQSLVGAVGRSCGGKAAGSK